jgi:hypothetical protein
MNDPGSLLQTLAVIGSLVVSVMVLAALLVAVLKFASRPRPDEDSDNPAPAEFADDEPELPPGVRVPGPDERLVKVYASTRAFDAELHKVALLDAGIWAHVDGVATDAVLGGVGLGGVQLVVPEADADTARQLIADREAGPADGEDEPPAPPS